MNQPEIRASRIVPRMISALLAVSLGILIGTSAAANPIKPQRIENKMSLRQAFTTESAGNGANKVVVLITADPAGKYIRQLKQGKTDTMDRGELIPRRTEKLKVIRPKIQKANEPITVDIIKVKGKSR